MSLKEFLRRGLRRCGYSVFRSRALPVGLDLVADISRIKDFASMQIVFDVGANVGDWTRDYLPYAPSATFYCFEPTADTFRTLSRRMAQRPRVRTIQAAAGALSGTAPLHRIGTSVQHSLNAPASEQAGAATETVQVVTLDEFATAHGIEHIDLLKTDTEGYDAEVLAGAHRMLESKRIDFVFVEVNFAKGDAGHSDFDAIAALLGKHGYQPVGFYDVHLWGPPWFVMYMNVLFTCI
jgi:FkbM family methyltransferase